MSEAKISPEISVVVPMFNEADGLQKLYAQLASILDDVGLSYEIVFCNDGSTDSTVEIFKKLAESHHNLRLLSLTTNFGKENALTAGIASARGKAIITIDADGQHPVDLIPSFIKEWQNGAKVVVGIRKANRKAGLMKLLGSKLFYFLSSKELIPGSTDYRLIDQDVQKVFLSMPERDRITRGLIDWLGFKSSYIYFTANPRTYGRPTYSRKKLFKLAASSLVSQSPTTLFLFSYLGGIITLLSSLLGVTVIVEQLILGDPLHWNFTGTAMLSILLVFFVGLVLISQGIMSLYISHIHAQSMQRPLYVIDHDNSIGTGKNDKTE
jgi:dolichol-phosphate mannosyltransferase